MTPTFELRRCQDWLSEAQANIKVSAKREGSIKLERRPVATDRHSKGFRVNEMEFTNNG